VNHKHMLDIQYDRLVELRCDTCGHRRPHGQAECDQQRQPNRDDQRKYVAQIDAADMQQGAVGSLGCAA